MANDRDFEPDTEPRVRRLPIPTSVSPRAQQFLGAPTLGDAGAAYPDLDDSAAWRAHIAQADAGLLAAALPASTRRVSPHERDAALRRRSIAAQVRLAP